MQQEVGQQLCSDLCYIHILENVINIFLIKDEIFHPPVTHMRIPVSVTSRVFACCEPAYVSTSYNVNNDPFIQQETTAPF